MDSRQRFVSTLKTYYSDQEGAIRVLDEFEQNYKPCKAIWLYIRTVFLCHILNKALRQHNIECLLSFGFFVHEFYRQLKEEQFKSKHLEINLTVYREQITGRTEIEELANPTVQNINSFFSTSCDAALSVAFLPEPDQLQRRF
jgi:hypothetical protein